jgi:hypothetical protein
LGRQRGALGRRPVGPCNALLMICNRTKSGTSASTKAAAIADLYCGGRGEKACRGLLLPRGLPALRHRGSGGPRPENAAGLAVAAADRRGHIPPNKACVIVSVWRDYCYRGSISTSENPMPGPITGFVEIGVGRLEALAVAEERAHGDLVPAGQVRFGFAGKRLWPALDMIRAGRAERSTRVVPVEPVLMATIKFFGRYKTSNLIRDGVLLDLPRLREGSRR